MAADRKIDELRRQTNPLFNDRKLKLGTFCTNLDYGCAMSSIDGTLRISWPNTLTLARMADEMQLEAIVPVARWRGFGGKINFNGAGFETYTWAAGLASATNYSTLFSTSHLTTMHPMTAAKQGTTIDHITGGRFALNVVTGWNRPEIEMFGIDMPDHDTRYDIAVEWLDIIRRLWTEDEEFDFEGKFYKIKKGYPAAEADPEAVSGDHECGRLAEGARVRRQVRRHGVRQHRFARSRRLRRAGEGLSRSRARRSTGATSRCGPTPMWCRARPRRRRATSCANTSTRRATGTAAENLVNTMGLNALTFPPEVMQEMKRHFIGGWAGFPIIGTKEQIVDTMLTLSNKVGLDGILLAWARYEPGMREFKEKTLPLVKQAGLR